MGCYRPIRGKDKEILHIFFRLVELVKKQIELKQISGQDRIDALSGDGMCYGCAAFLELFLRRGSMRKFTIMTMAATAAMDIPRTMRRIFVLKFSVDMIAAFLISFSVPVGLPTLSFLESDQTFCLRPGQIAPSSSCPAAPCPSASYERSAGWCAVFP